MNYSLFKKLLDTLFYSNIFIGICAVILCIETNLQYHISPNSWHFYIFIFLSTLYYYTSLYLKNISNIYLNERIVWYRKNAVLLRKIQLVIFTLLILYLLFYIGNHYYTFISIGLIKIGLIFSIPLVAIAYSYNVLPFYRIKNLRQIGLIKPFIIGYVWSGFVSIYPIIFYQIQENNYLEIFSLFSIWLWLKNFMFISILCIMFDIKDYIEDKSGGLRTYAVLFGIQNTISFVIMPLIAIEIFFFFAFYIKQNFSILYTYFNIMPYILIFISSFSLRKKRSLMYYLFVIDGLMIAKAICGIIAVSIGYSLYDF